MRSIAIQIVESDHVAMASLCAERLGLPVFCQQDNADGLTLDAYDLLLCYDRERWCLRRGINTARNGARQKQATQLIGGLTVDFISGASKHRFLYGGGKGQDIAKAVGASKVSGLNVLDATAGLGRDAFVLASLGCRVQMCEVNPIIHFLLDHALVSGMAQLTDTGDEPVLLDTLQRLSLAHDDSVTLMQDGLNAWDVIYLDPMFPERRKSAKVKKEMQYLHHLLMDGADPQEMAKADERLLESALNSGCARVVVKRPSDAPTLSERVSPSHSIKGKSTRFDVYAMRSLT
ncbi:MAG: class I SAM-dependent methyltransferase [Pseudomonadota bacterium]